MSPWGHHHPHISALQSNRNRNHCPWSKDNHLGLELGCAGHCSLSGLFMGTPAESGFALSSRLGSGAANIQVPWIVLPDLLLHSSPPWGKVGSEELQQWMWELATPALWLSNAGGFPSSQLPPLWFPSPRLCGCSLWSWCSVVFCSHPLPFHVCLSPNALTNELTGRQGR